MPNQVYIKNKLKKINPELGEELDKMGKRNLRWGVQPEREEKPKKKENKKESE